MSISQPYNSVYEKWKAGALEWDIDRGIIRTAVVTYCQIYDEYIKHRAVPGTTYLQAVETTAEIMNTSPETVKRAIAEVI